MHICWLSGRSGRFRDFCTERNVFARMAKNVEGHLRFQLMDLYFDDPRLPDCDDFRLTLAQMAKSLHHDASGKTVGLCALEFECKCHGALQAHSMHHSPSLGRPFPVHFSISCVYFSRDDPKCSSMVLAEKKCTRPSDAKDKGRLFCL